MEMHSYAKTRTNKKWSLEHKRKLVDNRITLDVLFNKKAFNLADSWRKLTKVSDMESFDVLFVRKQWTNILTKYKNLVQRHAINNYIDNETLDLLTAEWEFFDKIHRWIKVKEKIQKDYKSIILEEIENETLNQSITGGEIITTNNHSRYVSQNQQQLSNSRDSSENDEPMVTLNVAVPSSSSSISNVNSSNDLITSNKKNLNINDEQLNKNIIKSPQQLLIDVDDLQLQQQQQPVIKSTRVSILEPGPSTLTSPPTSSSIKTKEKSQKRKPSLSDISSRINLINKNKRKYRKLKKKLKRLKRNYSSHKLSANRLSKKLNVFCEIFAKVIKQEYPNINVSNLIDNEEYDSSSYDSSDTD
ncbi:uncharacterized protein LOC129607647 [Condylostylus longicornis]|uniref:uncharacterized protein LOC129607647 n=1 Tax=Condylostylus longicornis TaxID=2530218 RepID=UPI00244DA574|nr:uncharacterized protein LOC129607647 [Condylostylus longicornis]